MPMHCRLKSFFYLLRIQCNQNMNKSYFRILTGFSICLFLTGCAYNTRDVAPKTETCDNSKTYRFADVRPILENKLCTSCHETGGTSPDLSDSTKVRNYINANKSSFISAIRFEGEHPMPKNGPEMPDSLQKKIESWICQGMK